MAKPMKVKEFSTRPVWQEDTWLQKHAGETLGVGKDPAKESETPEGGGGEEGEEGKENTAEQKVCIKPILNNN
jgi:peptidyl-prolyl isomerase E (cyclophilin E)